MFHCLTQGHGSSACRRILCEPDTRHKNEVQVLQNSSTNLQVVNVRVLVVMTLCSPKEGKKLRSEKTGQDQRHFYSKHKTISINISLLWFHFWIPLPISPFWGWQGSYCVCIMAEQHRSPCRNRVISTINTWLRDFSFYCFHKSKTAITDF